MSFNELKVKSLYKRTPFIRQGNKGKMLISERGHRRRLVKVIKRGDIQWISGRTVEWLCAPHHGEWVSSAMESSESLDMTH